MRPGSVIVDLAAETGGNVELTKAGETVVHNGVSIMGQLNLPSTMPVHASQMYAKNIQNLLDLLVKDGQYAPDFDDEIVRGTIITRQGEVVHEMTRQRLAEAGVSVERATPVTEAAPVAHNGATPLGAVEESAAQVSPDVLSTPEATVSSAAGEAPRADQTPGADRLTSPSAQGIIADAGSAAPSPGELSVPEGAVAGNGSHDCPDDFPIKGNASSLIYHMPGEASYSQTIPELCFASTPAAEAAGYRASRA
jgi:hypothetical protein